MRGFRVARLFGVDVHADLSLVLLGVILTWSLYLRFSQAFPRLERPAIAWLALGGGSLFLASVLAHELSHSLVARRRGLVVRRIRLYIFGGVSEIEDDARTPGEEFVVAFAGPLASVAIGAGLLFAGWASPDAWRAPATMLRLIGAVNIALALFNLLPGLPLDGGRVLHAFLWHRGGDHLRATRAAVTAGKVVGIAAAVAGLWALTAEEGAQGLWLLVVGWFLFQAATATRSQEELRHKVAGVTVADVMRPIEVAAAGTSSVAELLEMHGWGERLRTLPVEVDGRVRGVIGERELAAVAEADRPTTTVAAAMTPIGAADTVEAEVSLADLLGRDGGGAGRVVVVREGRVVGLVTGDEVAEILDW
jgi:Zn-dependent protease